MINEEEKSNRRGKIELNHPHKLTMWNWKDNWQLKIIAFILAVALWFYLYRQ